tara:strand:+ start:14 stop:286 length:273 start_codon:yes stop_codon:yes gene_type:complete
MKIGIVGAGGAELAQMKIVMAKMGHEVFVVSADDVEKPKETERKVIAMCGHTLANMGIDCFPSEATAPKIDYSFRGGSISKGGKVKYKRG